MTKQTADLIVAMQSIPYGKVASYGQIAKVMGYPRGARQVSWTLRTQSKKHKIPWHRIINSQGEIAIKNESASLQKSLLEDEGVMVIGRKVKLKVYQWNPSVGEVDQMKLIASNMISDYN